MIYKPRFDLTNKKFDTNKEALEYAFDYLNSFCKTNGYEMVTTHNTRLVTSYHDIANANRCFVLTKKDEYGKEYQFLYKLVIKNGMEFTDDGQKYFKTIVIKEMK